VNLPKLAAGPPAAPNSATLAFSAAPDLPLPPEQAIKKGEHFSSTETQYVNWNDKP